MISLKSYSAQLVEHFNHPQNVGHFDESDPTVRTGRAGCAESGDCVRIQIKIREDIIEDICFKAQGSCATIAVASWLCSTIKNKTLEYSKALTPDAVLTALELPPVKKHNVLLVLDALNKACIE
jgi:NifU-like protein involved in Fe-S cluster formation